MLFEYDMLVRSAQLPPAGTVISENAGGGVTNEDFLYGTMADCTLLPRSLTRKWYIKKILEITLNVP